MEVIQIFEHFLIFSGLKSNKFKSEIPSIGALKGAQKIYQIYCLEKLYSRELFNIELILKVERPTAQTYFEKNFQNPELEWKDIYTLP